MGIIIGLLRLWRKRRDRQLTPGSGAVATPQLRPEMPEIERGIDRTVGVRQHRRNRIAEKLYVDDVPRAVMAHDFEQTLVGCDMEPLRHPLLPFSRRTAPEIYKL